MLGLVNRALPDAGAAKPGAARRGLSLTPPLVPSPLTALMNRAARDFNQYGGAPRASAEHACRAGTPSSVPRVPGT